MAKNPFEEALKKQNKALEKQAREEARRQRAASIVNGQPVVGGMRIMDEAAEEILKLLLDQYNGNEYFHISTNTSLFPAKYHSSMTEEVEKLKQYGMVTGTSLFDLSGNVGVTLTPMALSYFENKAKAYEEDEKMKNTQIHIGSIVANGSNLVLGDVINSTLSVDNSMQRIEKEIEEKGGEDAEELRKTLEDVKEYIENMQESKHVAKNKGLFAKLSNHLEKHGWFYGEVIGLLGTAVLQLIQG